MLVNSIFNYPVNTTFFSTSDKLEIGNIPFISHSVKPTRTEALEYYRRVCDTWQLNLSLYNEVNEIIKEEKHFELKTSEGILNSKKIVICTGFYDIPYMLNIPGEDKNKVLHYYNESHPYYKMDIAIVGAGNSAVDVALDTFRKGAKSVTMIIREKEIGKNIKYSLIEAELPNQDESQNRKLLLSKNLLKQILQYCNIKKYKLLRDIEGDSLNGTIALHPLYKNGFKNKIPLLDGEFVDESEGTGFVHIATSYGEDYFNLAKINKIEVKDVVEDNGVFKEGVPLFSGLHIFKADKEVIESLKIQKHLVGIRDYMHSYPHSWRSKKPVIYRTTPQWFISCLLYTSPSPRDRQKSRMPSCA